MARGRKSSWRVVLSPVEQDTLPHGQRSTTIVAGLARRRRMILLLAAGPSQSEVAHLVGVQRPVVRQGAKRLLAQRLAGLADAPGRGAQGFFSPRGGHPRGAPGLRATRDAGSEPRAMGWPRTGPPAQRRGPRGGHRRRAGAAAFTLPYTQALALSSLAPPQVAQGRRMLCHGLRAHRTLYPPAA
jgi:hypothetical protein